MTILYGGHTNFETFNVSDCMLSYEMVYFHNVVFDTPARLVNLASCITVETLTFYESCICKEFSSINIVDNNTSNSGGALIRDDIPFSIRNGVIARNKHTALSSYSQITFEETFFCLNSFIHQEMSGCVPTLRFANMVPPKCRGNTALFTGEVNRRKLGLTALAAPILFGV